MEFFKVNDAARDWRDLYHWILSLTWGRFTWLVLGLYLALNVVFATAYWVQPGSIAEMPQRSFSDAFFFSIETLATVGYGHMHPATFYGHVVVSIETLAGMFSTAVMTGVIFVRFSRPTAKILFSNTAVIAPFDGKLTLMLRVANGRHQSMVDTSFYLMLILDEPVLEGDTARRFYQLKLTFDRIVMFPAALTLRHVIDETSRLHGMTPEDLKAADARLMVCLNGIDTVIPAPMQSQHDYRWSDIRFGEQFVEIYSEDSNGRYTVDYGRLHETVRM
jgi:inward rectifier potassium channel